ncbi:MAG: hypothetical protein ABW321_17780 [Polyangiales bacterium]
MSEHIPADLALFVATLAPHHPERRAAELHAQHCPRCNALLQQSRVLLASLPLDGPRPPPDPRLKQRILRAVTHLPQRDRHTALQLQLTLGLLVSVALALADARARHGVFAAHGHLCLLWELGGALGALLLMHGWTTHTRRRPDARRAVRSALLGGLAGQLWLRACCPTYDVGLHSLLFHVLGVALAALVGLLTGCVLRKLR